jgi:hypothetical protein
MTHSICDSDGDSRWSPPRLVDPVVGRPNRRRWLGSRHRLRSRAKRARGRLVWRGERSGRSGDRARVAKGLRVPRAAEKPLAEQSALATLRAAETVVDSAPDLPIGAMAFCADDPVGRGRPQRATSVWGVSPGCLGGSWFGWVCELGLTRMHGLASVLAGCLAIDLSAWSAYPSDTHRSGGVTY